jgi:hypothetical protein
MEEKTKQKGKERGKKTKKKIPAASRFVTI